MDAFLRTTRGRLRGQAGFGMIELLAAMIVMAIGILALFAMFHASSTQMKRAAYISTAAAIAEGEMERYRAVRYDTIGLATTDVDGVDALYTSESGGAYMPVSSPANAVDSTVVLPKCPTGEPQCTTSVPTKQVTGPDGVQYRVDTYITWLLVTNQNGVAGRPVKRVTIVVRGTPGNRTYARVSSSFDELSGV